MESNYQKKIEKISQAIYLVSNHLKDTEPLKWELRKESIGFLSCIRSLGEDGDNTNVPADLVLDALTSYGKDLISLISLARVSGLISRINGELLIKEIEQLILSFTEGITADTARAGFVLSHDFFAADPELQERLGFKQTQSNKLPFLSDESLSTEHKQVTQNSQIVLENKDTIKDKKNGRQERILLLLKNQSNLTIKDFATVISDCSEKTIQRELIELVEKGVIKKEGERRWSTYSLK